MKIVKGIGNSVLAFLLTLSFVAGFALILVSNTVLNKEYVLGQLTKNQYYEKVEADLKNGFEEYQYQSGFPGTVFENLCSREMIEKDIESRINYWYDGTEVVNHSANVSLQIKENIDKYLAENNINITEKQRQNIDDFEKIMVDVYENKIELFSKYNEQIRSAIEKIRQIVNRLKKILIGVLIAILVITLLFNVKDFAAFISTVATSLLASGVLLELMKFVIEKNIDIEHILILTQSLSDLMKEIIYDILAKISWFGILFIIVGILSIIVSNCRKKKE